MTQPETPPGIVTSAGSLGINHEASNSRSYWNNPNQYTNPFDLAQNWSAFTKRSRELSRRRALMRTLVTPDVLNNLTSMDIPVEAAIPIGQEYLVWIGQNQHQPLAIQRDVRNLPQPQLRHQPAGFSIDREVSADDINTLSSLWLQFGWTREGVSTFIQTNTNPIVVIRDIEQQVVAAMIAESLQFNTNLRLVELTEMAVNPRYRGLGLASILIQELGKQSVDHYGSAILAYGEYNISTKAFDSAARAGHAAAQTQHIDGVLRDHVAIETGLPNLTNNLPWTTEWLHNFLVMYQFGTRV